MATDIAIFHDAAGTSPVTAGNPLTAAPDASSSAAGQQKWIGSTGSGIKHRRKTLPGVNQLQLSVTDANDASGLAVTDVRFALTEAGLTSATWGASLNLGVEILSGVANMVSFWYQVKDSVAAVAQYSDLSISILDVRDDPA
jgi:hypothetical protein